MLSASLILKSTRILLLLLGVYSSPYEQCADWNQWRGGQRSGGDYESPALVNALPGRGLKPVWYVSEDDLPAAAASGWSSPVVSGNSVYLYTHKKEALTGTSRPNMKF